MYFREEIDKMKEASFDFGKKPPVDGYTKVTEKSVYTKEKGFGLSEVAEADLSLIHILQQMNQS